MGPKKAKGKGKKAKKEKDKRPKTPKSEYITRITERNAVLAAARRRAQEAEDAYFSAEKRYEQTQEDMTDIIKYLQHEIEENNLEIAAFDQKIASYKEEINENDKHYQGILTKMKALYEDTEKALQYKIRQHIPKLSAFEEIRLQREEYLKKKDLLWKKMQELKARHEKDIYEAEQQVIIKQDAMQKDMEAKLTRLATDFNQATDIAIGETTNKLIKENIILGNMLTCTQEIFERARDSYQKVHDKEKRIRYSSELMDEEHHQVIQRYTVLVNNIECLLRSQEELHERLSLNGQLTKENRRLQREITEKECTLNAEDAEYEGLLKKLNECEEKFNLLKTGINAMRKSLVNLEVFLYEASRKVKQGIDVENISELPEEYAGEDATETELDEQEENLKEFQYKVRQGIIDEVLVILYNSMSSDMEPHLETLMSELQIASQSTFGSTAYLRSRVSSKRIVG